MELKPIMMDARTKREEIRRKAIDGLKQAFPMKLRDSTIELLEVKYTPMDFGPEAQKRAIITGSSLNEIIKGVVVLKDASGKVVEKINNLTLLHLPYFTERHTFIINGNEYQVANQLRMKPGVYTRRRANEELEATFNLSKGANFKIILDPRYGLPYMEYESTRIPLYAVLIKMGLSHLDVAQSWGTEVAAANKSAFEGKHDAAIDKLYRKLIHPAKQVVTTTEGKLDAIHATYALTSMDPEVNQTTLGHSYDKVTALAILSAARKLLAVYKAGEDVDDRDSLAFKTLHSVDDFIKQRILLDSRMIQMKVKLRSTGKTELRDIIPTAAFSSGVRSFLTTSQLSEIPTQINPMELIDHSMKVTSLGEGGIASERAIPLEARQLHGTHLGVLDPVRTPETFKAGVDIRATMVARRDEHGNLYTLVRNMKNNKFEYVSAKDLQSKKVLFPGQGKTGKLAMLHKGKPEYFPHGDADYEIPTGAHLYSPSTNLVPMLESMQGNRGTMGAKMQTQALPLVDREVPHVQVGHIQEMGNGVQHHTTFEKELGRLVVPTAPVSGTIEKVDNEYIYIRPHGTKKTGSAFRAKGPHTKTLADGRTIDVYDLWDRTAHLPVTRVPVRTLVPNDRRDPIKGFSPDRYADADTRHPLLLRTSDQSLLDGRHRLARLIDAGAEHAEVRHVPDELLAAVKTAGAPKRQTTIKGLLMKIELEPGDERSGTSPEGKTWSKTMTVCYGHIPRTTGEDGETVDVYLNEDGTFDEVFVVHQLKKDGSADEDKCMIGFKTEEQAKAAYKKHGPEWGFGSISTYDWDEFVEDYVAERTKSAADKDLIKVPYETYFPFASKTHLHQTVSVKAGDTVKAGDVLAESNFTKGGTLALGKNMRVAYMAYYGMNSNDAVVISESAAKKMTSEHMYKEIVDVNPEMTIGKNVHKQYFGSKYTSSSYANIADNGIIKKGAIVATHDPLVVGVRKSQLTAADMLFGNLKKSLAKPFKEYVLAWEHESPGEVVDIYESQKRVVVTLKTLEPLRVGDKLCYDEETEVLTEAGWKPVSAVTLTDRVATLRDESLVYEEPTATHMYPEGGTMYRIATQQVDQFVTLDHQMYVQQRNAADFELTPARNVVGKRVAYKKDALWFGADPAGITFPAMTVKAGQGGTGERELPEFTLPVSTYMMLLGAFLSEGNLVEQPDHGNYGIDITQIKEPARARLLEALSLAEVKYTEHSNGTKVRLFSKQLLEHFRTCGDGAVNKHIPNNVFAYSRSSLQTLFKWLMWGDGHTSEAGLPIHYTTVSPQLADDVQRLCLHIGKAANIISRHEPIQVIRGKAYNCRRIYNVRIVNTKLTPTVNHGHAKSQKAQTEQVIEGYDRPVYCLTVPSHVLYVRRNGKPVWSGNCGRYGNKGVVSVIIPDAKMVHDEAKKPIDILFTSNGVISRINPSQVIETALGKVVEKTGKPISMYPFSGKDNVAYAKALLKEHGISDKETLYDPISGKATPNIHVGRQYILKLFKTTDANYSARGTGKYDVNLQPTKGGTDGAKGMGGMEFNALVAHDARNVIRETAAIKSTKSDEFWRAVQLGLPLPSPKSSFIYDKFNAMLTASGIRPDRNGDMVTLRPLTDNDITKMSSGAIENEKLVRSKDLKAEKGGFFDPTVTGGTTGTKWSHIALAEPMMNPVFMDPARRLLGMTNADFEKALYTQGAAAMKTRLNAVDLAERERSLVALTKTATGAKLDDALKQIKAVRALRNINLKAGDAYILSKLPVTPPIMRPIRPGQGNSEMVVGDPNYLYQNAFLHNKALSAQVATGVLPPDEHAALRKNLFTAVGAVIGTHETDNPKLEKRGVKGFLIHLTGKTTPKSSFFHDKILSRQLDLSGRGTIVPDVNLGMDEIGVPEEMLWQLYGKFLVARLVRRGYPAMQAAKMVEDKHPAARDALLVEAKERPVMTNRAPTLHRYNLVGAYAVPIAGKTLKVSPFIEKGMGADYDGDTFQIHAPISPQAVEEVKRMTVSSMVLSDKVRDTIMAAPEMEAVLGLHLATKDGDPNGKVHKFKTKGDAMAAYHKGELKMTDNVEIG